MLSEYNEYLLSLSNNLIRCGVNFQSKHLREYSDTVCLERELNEILWYYTILSVSGSKNRLKEFILPLNGTFKSKMREILYQEYLQSSSIYATISVRSKLRELGIFTGGTPIDSGESIEDTESEELIDLFEDEEPIASPKVSEVVHGVYIEDIEDLDDDTDEVVVDDQEYAEHGVFIEDILEEDVEDDGELEYDSSEEDDWGYDEDSEYDTSEDDNWGYDDEEEYEGDELEYDTSEDDNWGYDDEEAYEGDELEYDTSEDDNWGYDDEEEYEEESEELEYDSSEDDNWGYDDEEEGYEEELEYDSSEDDNWGYDDEEEYEDDSEEELEYDSSEDDNWGYEDEDTSEVVNDGDMPDWSDETPINVKSEDSKKLDKISEDADKIRDITSRFVSTGLSGISKGINKLKNSSK